MAGEREETAAGPRHTESFKGAVRGISELALWVNDLDRAVAFYRDYLGFEVQEIDPGKNAFLKSGDLLLVLFVPHPDPGTKLARDYLTRTGGARGEVYHVAFRLDASELDAYCLWLRDAGMDVSGPINFDSGRRSYFVEDPDEHYIELTDR